MESLAVYPVKSCAGVAVTTASVQTRGLESDRRWMIVDTEGRYITQREVGELARVQCQPDIMGIQFLEGPLVREAEATSELDVTIWGDEVRARLAPESASRWLSRRIGRSVRLVFMDAACRRPVDPVIGQTGDEVSFADGYPMLIASSSSLESLNARLPDPVSMRRFRPNIVIEGAQPFAEDRWRTVRIGNVKIDLVKSCARCVVVDTDPDTGHRSKGVLREMATFRRAAGKVHFGQNAIPRGVGRISVGDRVTVLREGPARPAV